MVVPPDDQPVLPATGEPDRLRSRPSVRRRGNQLDGATWLRYSISIWSDIRKSRGERGLNHPAVFPLALADRLIQCFTMGGDRVVLDPFVGSGSVLLAACRVGKTGIGVDVSAEYLALADERLRQAGLVGPVGRHRLVQADARKLHHHVEPGSVDLCITSPPYWNILNRRRTADGRARRNYLPGQASLGDTADYEQFLDELVEVFSIVRATLRSGKYCIVNVMDIRKRRDFFPLHADLAARLRSTGWIYDDLIVWDRRQEYNRLRPLGAALLRRRTRGVQEGLRAAWQELLDPAKAG